MNYIYLNKNPKNEIKQDCVCRAISLAMDMDYYDVEYLLNTNADSRSCDTLVKSCYRQLLEGEFGLKSHKGHRRSVKETASRYPNNRLIMRVQGHLTASLYGRCYDTFDCTHEIVDEYWIIP